MKHVANIDLCTKAINVTVALRLLAYEKKRPSSSVQLGVNEGIELCQYLATLKTVPTLDWWSAQTIKMEDQLKQILTPPEGDALLCAIDQNYQALLQLQGKQNPSADFDALTTYFRKWHHLLSKLS